MPPTPPIRAWWELPRRIWSILGLLGVWSLANNRLERPKNRGLEQQGQRLCARKRQVATLEQHRLTATGLGGTAKAHSRAWWKLPRRIWSILGVLGVWSLANVHWSLVTLFTVSMFWSKKDRVTSDQVCLESHTCHTKMVRPLCGRLWPYSCPKYNFWRKSRRKASLLSFEASFLKEVSQKSFVLELRSSIFEGSFAEKLGFWVWKLQFWRKSRRKASF